MNADDAEGHQRETPTRAELLRFAAGLPPGEAEALLAKAHPAPRAAEPEAHGVAADPPACCRGRTSWSGRLRQAGCLGAGRKQRVWAVLEAGDLRQIRSSAPCGFTQGQDVTQVGSPTLSALRTPSKNLVTREMTTARRHPEVPGQRQEAERTVGVTAPTGPVREFFRPCPWTRPDAHGRIADGGGSGHRLERRIRWSAALASARSDGL